MKIPELRKLAAEKGLKGISGLRKGELIQAIVTGQVPRKAAAEKAAPVEKPEKAEKPAEPAEKQQPGDDDESRGASRSAARRARRNRARSQHDEQQGGENRDNRDNRDEQDGNQERGNNDRGGRNNHGNNHDHHGGGRRGRRGRRNRNRNRDHNNGGGNHGNNGNNNDNQNFNPEDLQDVAGIADVQDNGSAFIRTTGYRQSNADVYVPQKLVRQSGLRSGDAVTAQVRANGQSHSQGNGRNRRSYNQVVRVDSINGQTTEAAKARKEFHKLTPLYPNRRLRLETEPKILTTRVIDLVMPIGKGQRALIVSPPKAGKTTILQNIANAIATNNPECYLMV
ncbi:Rho termination factor N-terminal domain-containing protein, partial [Corynebacterium haemomassiliense]|uniref:Rho termination factor N-terminal domain-containing protein n=1 Tax=Corynebacterium haemomassiliense TaxID=2754726 RepID=UPI002889FFB4